MNIKIEKCGNHYRADCTDLPGSPPVGTGQNPELAIACLFYLMKFEKPHPDRSWMDYIVYKEPIVVNGETWKPDFTPQKTPTGKEPEYEDIVKYCKERGWDVSSGYYGAREHLREEAYGPVPSGYQSWGDYWKAC